MKITNLLSVLLLGAAMPATATYYMMGIGDACAPACFYPVSLTIDPGDTVSFYLYTGDSPSGRHNVVADDGSFRCARGCDGDGQGGSGTPADFREGFGFSRGFTTPGRIGIHDEVSGARAEIIVRPQLLGPGLTGAWYDPAQAGHGLFLEVLPGDQLLAAWLTFDPAGNQAWFVGIGTYSGNTAFLRAMDRPSGGRWIPNFNASSISHNAWGTLVFTFTDCNSGRVDFFSTEPGFGSGGMTLKRLTMPAGLTCP